MQPMSDADRRAVVEEIMLKNRDGEPDSLDFADLLAMVSAIDDFSVSIAADFNAAIPQPARGVLLVRQKSLYFALVLRRRAMVGVST